MARFPVLKLIMFFLAAWAACSCSVLEDREQCPCYLDVDYSGILDGRPLGGQSAGFNVTVYNPSPVDEAVYSPETAPRIDSIRIRKSMAKVVGVFHNRPGRMFLSGGTRVTWEEGNQMDSVYVHSTDVDCTGEEAYCLLEAHKQFSTLTFLDGTGGSELRKYNMVVRGATCGFDAADFTKALDGPYLCDVQEDDGRGNILVRVPRQKDDSLVLEFWTKDSLKRKLYTCPVGAYMMAAGYDGRMADLQDFVIRIDFRSALVYIRVADWEDEYVYALYK